MRSLLGQALVLALVARAAPAAPGAEDPRVRAFEHALLAKPSATQVLTRWCADHRLADPARIVAVRRRGVEKPADAEVRRLLGATPGETVAYRRVDLDCGAMVLSRADNWYRPAALTPAMNIALETTDAPFGKVVEPLRFNRRTLDVQVPRSPEAGILRVRAVLETGAGRPFALVRETYSDALLGGPP
jgi:hypothetical protein